MKILSSQPKRLLDSLLKKSYMCRKAHSDRSAFKYKKAVQALNFFAQKEGGKIDKMKAIQLIWLADRLHLRTYYRTVTGDVYYAMPYGPVASQTLDIVNRRKMEPVVTEYADAFLKNEGKHYFVSTKALDVAVFSKTDVQSMKRIYDHFGKYKGTVLSDYSHVYPEWKRCGEALESEHIKSARINREDFFENPKDKKVSPIFDQSEELLNLSREFYLGE